MTILHHRASWVLRFFKFFVSSSRIWLCSSSRSSSPSTSFRLCFFSFVKALCFSWFHSDSCEINYAASFLRSSSRWVHLLQLVTSITTKIHTTFIARIMPVSSLFPIASTPVQSSIHGDARFVWLSTSGINLDSSMVRFLNLLIIIETRDLGHVAMIW